MNGKSLKEEAIKRGYYPTKIGGILRVVVGDKALVLTEALIKSLPYVVHIKGDAHVHESVPSEVIQPKEVDNGLEASSTEGLVPNG